MYLRGLSFPQFVLLMGCGLIPLPGSAMLHTGGGRKKVLFSYEQMTSGLWKVP